MKKRELIKDLGLNFDEVSEVFSESTLSSMQLGELKGGQMLYAKEGCSKENCPFIGKCEKGK